MTDVNVLSTERLRTLIHDTENTLKQLIVELERREFLQQENGIANLEAHLKDAELSLDSIRQFIVYLMSDLKERENEQAAK